MTFKELRSAKTPTSLRRYFLHQKARGICIFCVSILLVPFCGPFLLIFAIMGLAIFLSKKRLYDMLGYQSEISEYEDDFIDDFDYESLIEMQSIISDEDNSEQQKEWRYEL